MNPLDFRAHLHRVADFISTEGIVFAPLERGQVERALQFLALASDYEDAGRRAVGMAAALRTLADAAAPAAGRTGGASSPRTAQNAPPARTSHGLSVDHLGDRPPSPPDRPPHVAIDELYAPETVRANPSHPVSDDLMPLQVGCPRCGRMELVARGGGNPLPVTCRRCGYQGVLS